MTPYVIELPSTEEFAVSSTVEVGELASSSWSATMSVWRVNES